MHSALLTEMSKLLCQDCSYSKNRVKYFRESNLYSLVDYSPRDPAQCFDTIRGLWN